MSHCFAITFDHPGSAKHAFAQVHEVARAQLLLLDDAYIAMRPNGVDGVHVERPLLPGAASGTFWWIGGISRHLRPHDAGDVPRRLSSAAVERFTRSMTAGSSAVLLRVRKLKPRLLRPRVRPFLTEHRARIVRLTDHDGIASLPPADLADMPSAQDLAVEALQRIEARAAERSAKARQSADHDDARLARFRDPSGAADAVRQLVQRCRDAARNGQSTTLGYRFPSASLTDRGRAVHAGDPTWPRTLTGEPKAVYLAVERLLVAKGFVVEAAVLDYPGGLLGDVGLFLRWANLDDT